MTPFFDDNDSPDAVDPFDAIGAPRPAARPVSQPVDPFDAIGAPRPAARPVSQPVDPFDAIAAPRPAARPVSQPVDPFDAIGAPRPAARPVSQPVDPFDAIGAPRPAARPVSQPVDPFDAIAAPRPAAQIVDLPTRFDAPAAAARPVPRPPTRPVGAYRGLPRPVRFLGWVALSLIVGVVVGATAPTALRRIGAVAALQPGLLAWYSVRGLGFLAWGVLSASVLYGLLLSTKILDAIAHRPVSFALHKDLAIVAMILAALHAGLLVFDQSFEFTPRAILVPFASPYAPFWVGIGQLTFYTSLVVTLSFYVRRQIGQRAWRILHYVTFLSFIGAASHGIYSGSDSGSPWAFWAYLVPVATSVFLLTYRIVVSLSSRAHPPVERAIDGVPTGPRGPLDRPGAGLFFPPPASVDRATARPFGD